MNDVTRMTDRDEVLFAFHQAYDRPTAENIVEWVRRYPQFADDIRAHAAVAWDWATQAQEAEQPLDETMSARAYSQALNIIYSSEPASAPNESLHTNRTFQQMQAAIGKETYVLAREIDVDRSVLHDLFNGWMLPPIRRRLVAALVRLFNATLEEFNFALDSALQAPRLGHAKSSQIPSVVSRPCDDIIRESSMSDDRKSYWLGED